MRGLIILIPGLVLVVAFFSCQDPVGIRQDNIHLSFSTDTVTFDTLFTTFRSITRNMTVRNPYNENVLISQISLAGGNSSAFSLNINGIPGNEMERIEIPAHDSIFIFVEVKPDQNGQNLPVVMKDSIQFRVGSETQEVKLIAWGQDFHLINRQVLESSIWNHGKPYLIADTNLVSSDAILRIEPGTTLYFRKGAVLYVKGRLLAEGTFEKPVIFRGDRMEDFYRNKPEQWGGIVLFSGSQENRLNFCTIKNGTFGLQVGTIEHEGFASVDISNTRIENMSYAGIFAIKSKIKAYNVVVGNCGFYCLTLLNGGEYEFYHSTIANYWGGYSGKSRHSPAVVLSNNINVLQADNTWKTYYGPLKKAIFGNCLIFGNYDSELALSANQNHEFNYYFDHCILKMPESTETSDKLHYNNVWVGEKYDPKWKSMNPNYKNPTYDFNYELDTLSPAKDAGSPVYSILYPRDIRNKKRSADKGPDLGAFERIEK